MSKGSEKVIEEIHQIIQSAVLRSGGEWKQSFFMEVTQILAVVDKRDASSKWLTPT